MKRPEEIDDSIVKLQRLVKDWIEECEPRPERGSMCADFGEWRNKFAAFLDAEWKAEVTRQLKGYGWRVRSIEYTRVMIDPE